ncbi:SusE domain-containing protein [Pontibacter sp. BT310]|uniref:SusE domain-containing protein n=1 Tax=Pontibacter populi TaxID=890055 RepID=A0ABS6X714_9BACT|nr:MULTISPECIES: SusE domain-containing protein [Pontibacter]MBJ6116561.1 SusE domain-containing protein [Pontibacter sp. BT310]MBR0568985.1 SusE domain-containing protein [Microvirga sp. STS03]MBW3363414.1 SusE domain-containing protein [Pontibacter populi]
MKNWLNKYFMIFVASLALMSCEKDEDTVTVRTGTEPALTVSATNLVLLEDEKANDAVTLNWSASDFGYNAAVNYTLQFALKGTDFAAPVELNAGGGILEKKFTVEELNNLINKLQVTPFEENEIEVRVKATVSKFVEAAYSDVTQLIVTPYLAEPGYLYVPGGYQGWSPETAPALISVDNDGIYKGIISFVGATDLGFKINPARNWDMDYGSGATAGTLAEKGGNLTVPTADTYEITANTNTMTWSYKLKSWGLIGDATPGGWDKDTNLKYDNAAGVWKATIELKAGNIKFRFNDDWALNYGDDDTSNNILNQGGKDIPVTTAGTYEIVFDNENEDGSVTYSVTKK